MGIVRLAATEIQRNLTVKQVACKPVSRHLTYWICGEQVSSISLRMTFQMRIKGNCSVSSQHLTKGLVYSRNTFTFLCQLRAAYWNATRKSQNILQNSSVTRCSGDFKKDPFSLTSQAWLESKHANPSQICSVQITCALSFLYKSKGNCSGSLLSEDKIPDFFHNNVSLPL